jgi:dihydrolipoamide dehydrogenase
VPPTRAFSVACIDEWKNAGGPALGGTCYKRWLHSFGFVAKSSEHFDRKRDIISTMELSEGLSLDLAKMVGRKDSVVKRNNDG